MKLRRLEEKDAAGMLEWMHDIEISRQFCVDMLSRTQEDVLEFIRRADIIPLDGESIHYAIAGEMDEYFGTISLKSINRQDQNAEYAISLRRMAQGRGVGSAATEELLDIAFNELGLERVYLNVLSGNQRAIQLYEKCGFILEGEFRNHLYLRGQYQNLRWYGMLRKEYQMLKYKRGGGISSPEYTYSFLMGRRLAA